MPFCKGLVLWKSPLSKNRTVLLLPCRNASLVYRLRRSKMSLCASLLADMHTHIQNLVPLTTLDWSWVAHHTMPLAYEPIVLPCSSINCGDLVYRSTLDPSLRMEERIATPQGIALVGLIFGYLLATPGVLQGALDYYILAPMKRAMDNKVFTKDDIKIGKKIATGGFGTVYKGELDEGSGRPLEVIVKKAKEFGEAEVWMNERMMRQAPEVAAQFITAFEDGAGRADDPLWLVWRYEGDGSLYDFIQKKDFPYSMEPLLFGRELRLPRGNERKAVTYRVLMQQLLEALKEAHATGIVHRDIKPQNCIMSAEDRRLKLIDWGAAADLRIGINYVPNEFLLDPRYAPPQQYIMSTQTPRAPPAPVAALLSPVLWRLNNPDRFDMYSAGMVLLQLAFPSLRNDNNLINFRKKLKEQYNYDLHRWRQDCFARNTKEVEGFELLDLDGRSGWDLLCKLCHYNPTERVPAVVALAHPWFGSSGPIGNVQSLMSSMNRVAGKLGATLEADWLEGAIAKSGTLKTGGLTEAQLSDELGYKDAEAPRVLNASTTIAWWKGRQQEAAVKLAQKRERKLLRDLSASVAKLRRRTSSTIRKRQNGRPDTKEGAPLDKILEVIGVGGDNRR